MIFYGKQTISQKDINSVTNVLKSDFLTQGPTIKQFENRIAEYCGVKYAVATSSATSALHIACMAADLEPGEVLWTTPNTFVASANCARYCGANVDFVDINSDTYNMNVEELAKKLKASSVRPKIVVPVHFSGQSCDMERIHALAKEYGFIVLEDASHCIGGEYQNGKIGSCQYSDMAVFSFHPVKIITTGEGGMVLTNNEKLYKKLQLFRSHGITREENFMLGESDGPWYYEQVDLGYNYRMTDMQAALGYTQMERLDEFVARRRYLAKRYNELLKDLPLKLPYQIEESNSSWHLYVVRYVFDAHKLSKKKLFEQMKERGIVLNVHYIPIHTQPYYKEQGFKRGDFPVAENYYEEAFTLPLYYSLSDEQQNNVIASLKEVLLNAE